MSAIVGAQAQPILPVLTIILAVAGIAALLAGIRRGQQASLDAGVRGL